LLGGLLLARCFSLDGVLARRVTALKQSLQCHSSCCAVLTDTHIISW
jgi:hypothetical protein